MDQDWASRWGDSSKEELDGKEYDRVLPVELEDPATGGTRKLKIGFNNGDNPFVVAQQFIEKHGLSFNHAQDIAEYIQNNRSQPSGPATIGMDVEAPHDDDAEMTAAIEASLSQGSSKRQKKSSEFFLCALA